MSFLRNIAISVHPMSIRWKMLKAFWKEALQQSGIQDTEVNTPNALLVSAALSTDFLAVAFGSYLMATEREHTCRNTKTFYMWWIHMQIVQWMGLNKNSWESSDSEQFHGPYLIDCRLLRVQHGVYEGLSISWKADVSSCGLSMLQVSTTFPPSRCRTTWRVRPIWAICWLGDLGQDMYSTMSC